MLSFETFTPGAMPINCGTRSDMSVEPVPTLFPLSDAFNHLPRPHREILRLAYVERWTEVRIARHYGVSASHAHHALECAVNALEAMVEAERRRQHGGRIHPEIRPGPNVGSYPCA